MFGFISNIFRKKPAAVAVQHELSSLKAEQSALKSRVKLFEVDLAQIEEQLDKAKLAPRDNEFDAGGEALNSCLKPVIPDSSIPKGVIVHKVAAPRKNGKRLMFVRDFLEEVGFGNADRGTVHSISHFAGIIARKNGTRIGMGRYPFKKGATVINQYTRGTLVAALAAHKRAKKAKMKAKAKK